MVETRLSAEERKRSILMAALPVFARKGFEGATTRDIAEAAEVSEALLYRHFPSKESMYSDIQDFLCEHKDIIFRKFSALEPSTENLVQLTYTFMRMIQDSSSPDRRETEATAKLMVQSMLEDGRFARTFHESRFNPLYAFYNASVEAALRSGDMIVSRLNSSSKMWFSHHLAVFRRLGMMPEVVIYEYGKNHDALLLDTVWFALRGIGLTDAALEKYFIPQKLEKFYQEITSKG